MLSDQEVGKVELERGSMSIRCFGLQVIRGRSVPLLLASFCLALMGCSEAARPPLPEAYPGVISPVDVRVEELPPLEPFDARTASRQTPQQWVERFVQEHGADNVAVLVLDPVPSEQVRLLAQKLSRAGARTSFTRSHPSGHVCYVAPVADMAAYAEKLDVGEVKKIDATKRVVFIACDPVKLAAEIPTPPWRSTSTPEPPSERESSPPD